MLPVPFQLALKARRAGPSGFLCDEGGLFSVSLYVPVEHCIALHLLNTLSIGGDRRAGSDLPSHHGPLWYAAQPGQVRP